jgi:hypothetical protein
MRCVSPFCKIFASGSSGSSRDRQDRRSYQCAPPPARHQVPGTRCLYAHSLYAHSYIFTKMAKAPTLHKDHEVPSRAGSLEGCALRPAPRAPARARARPSHLSEAARRAAARPPTPRGLRPFLPPKSAPLRATNTIPRQHEWHVCPPPFAAPPSPQMDAKLRGAVCVGSLGARGGRWHAKKRRNAKQALIPLSYNPKGLELPGIEPGPSCTLRMNQP